MVSLLETNCVNLDQPTWATSSLVSGGRYMGRPSSSSELCSPSLSEKVKSIHLFKRTLPKIERNEDTRNKDTSI